ncbi:MAG: glycoside hydrolase family 3 C-terminal domain-containing protein [Propionibacteriaceae bacterium]|jgi:beta-glucosidase|nr:glycoside hydrolase family 3 C-terminal domain-containing protein [Propionibacteriaceae bacterium]
MRWRDPNLEPDARVAALLGDMTLDEKIAQLGSFWDRSRQTDVSGVAVGAEVPDGQVAPDAGGAPPQGQVAPGDDATGAAQDGGPTSYEQAAKHGLGHVTRVFGTRPVEVAKGVAELVEYQRFLVEETRLGIPAIVHEECLAGLTALGATAFPVPPSWGATFDPELIEAVGAAIGADMAALGVHQGLAPLLDVTRDYRWGRVEETIGEDPYLVGVLGAAYVKGVQAQGVIATLKHFVGYPASKAARNHAPVSMGPRELADVMLCPFEMAVREGKARSVMNSYTDIDGVPVAASRELLTDVLRGQWGFTGTVVSDYWAVPFLNSMHKVAPTLGEAAALAVSAGIDIELPDATASVHLAELVESGRVPLDVIDTAVERVLRLKLELGLLDPDWRPAAGAVELDSARNRDLARKAAEEAVIVLENDGILPLAAAPARIAVVGPVAGEARSLFGCYSFPNHVLSRYAGAGLGVAAPSVLDAIRASFPGSAVEHVEAVDFGAEDASRVPAAAAAAQAADLTFVTVGDIAGLFSQGTSGEGCDVETLNLPGSQGALVEAVLATGQPAILVLVTGRPYALGQFAGRAKAIVQAFMPGEEGAGAILRVITGAVNPSGRLPVGIPRHGGGQPGTYLGAPLAQNTDGISNLDPTPLYPFGHGLSYTSFAYSDLALSAADIPDDGLLEVACTVTNTGDRAGADVAQLYLRDVWAQVTRPVKQLYGFARVELAPGESKRVTFQLHADRTAFTGLAGKRIVEPGEFQLWIGRSLTDLPLESTFRITGAVREVGSDHVLTTPVTVASCCP